MGLCLELWLFCMHAWKYGEHHYNEEHSRPPGDADSAFLLTASSAPLTDDYWPK